MFHEAMCLHVHAIMHHTHKVARLEAMMTSSQSQASTVQSLEDQMKYLEEIREVA